MAIKEGWTGRVYEDFEVGDIYVHPLGRTTIAADNVWSTLMTQNTLFTQSVTDLSQNVMANLGWDEVRLPNPVFEGDTIYSRSEVLEKRESASGLMSELFA